MMKADQDKRMFQTWGGAAAFGVVLALLLILFHAGFLRSLFVGILAFVVLGAILNAVMATEDEAEAKPGPAPLPPQPEVPPKVSAPAAVAAVVTAPLPVVEEPPMVEVPEPETPVAKAPAAKTPVARKPAAKKPAAQKPAAKAAAPVAASVGAAPAKLAAARGGAADDLKQIKGVGPKLEKLLNSMGFYHYDQVAAWTAAEVAWVDENLEGFKGRVSRDGWVAQAKGLAGGNG
jgi:predicted flap endonuclease-1-like 5' DNA nuclease